MYDEYFKAQDELNDIVGLLTNGNWTIAKEKYINLNISPNLFRQLIDELSIGEIKDLTLLGFYARKG